ncbi:hypothetical protein B484DRAFT_405827, partial [Ochromonadaceae sp. CCMP2298]
TRIYADELKLAKERGCIDSVQREAVATLLNRITAGPGDIDRQPALESSDKPTRDAATLRTQQNGGKAGGGGGQQSQQQVAFVCNGCGGTGHKYRECKKSEHPDFNASKLAWALSDASKRLAAAGKTHIVNEKGDAGCMKPWDKKKGSAEYGGGGGQLLLLGSSAPSQVPDALPAIPQTRDAAEQLPAPIQQPAKPAGGQSRNRGAPHLGGADEQKKSEPGSPAIDSAECSESSERAGLVPRYDTDLLSYIPAAAHTPGRTFLGSEDVRRVKHVSEMLEFTKEIYGMLGEDSELFPDASIPLTTADILAQCEHL